ncbi:MAG: hypothetical protein Q6M04_05460, partial [Thermostichus sp. BF3_bins_97]
MQALVANLAGIGRVDQDQLHAFSQTLIGQKEAKLVERPTVTAPTLRFVARLLVGSLSDAGQILQGDAGRQRFGSFNDASRNSMIHPTLEPTLTTRQPLQQSTHSAACTACALTGFVLELGSQVGQVVTNLGYGLSIPVLSLRSVSNIGTP